jgi:hypothetical protein
MAACAPGKYAPEFRPQAGDRHTASYKQNEFITIEAMGMSYILASRATLSYDMEVLKVAPDGLVDLKCTFGPMKFELDSDIAKLITSMQEVDMRQVVRVLEGAQGESFTTAITPDGTVRYVTASGLADRLMTKANITSGPARGFMRFWIDRFLSETRLREQMKSLFYMYNSTPMAVGESWTKRDTFSSAGMTMSGEAKLTLAALADGVATITESITIPPESQGQMNLGPGADMKVNSSGSGHGQYQIDAESGWLKGFQSDLKGTGTTTYTGPVSLSLTVTSDLSTSGTFR